MKRFTFVLGCLLAFAFQLNAQDYVSTTPANRNVILEEFTGRNCGYCPDGHVIANQIAANNPGRFWAINVHAGGFSPTSYPNLNTTDGTAICSQGFNCTSFPGGVVNRSTAASIGRGQWTSTANTQLSQQAEVNVAGIYMIDHSSRQLSVTVEVYYTGNSASTTNYLTVAMLQDSIMGSQSGMSSNPAQIVNGQYCHMHILRDIITPTWGDPITPTTQGTLITRTYTYSIPETIGSPNGVEVDLDNLHFLAWVSEQYQGTPTRPILNACQLEESFEGIHVFNVTPTEIAPSQNTNLTVTMKNYDETPTSGNTTVTISSTDSYLTIVNGTATFGTMSGNGGTATVNNAFTVRAAENTPNGHVFTINAVATNNGTTTNSSFALTCNAPCDAPTNLTGTASSNTVELSWTASPTAGTYRVFRGNTMIANDVTGTTYTDNGNLNYNTQYCYTVKTNCISGDVSEASNQVCVTTGAPCTAPNGVHANLDGFNVNVTWNSTSSALSYMVFRDGEMIAEDLHTTAYTDENVAAGHHCYTVKSECVEGPSPASVQACVDIELPCFAPENLDGSYVFNSQNDFGALIEWDAPAEFTDNLVRFNVYSSTNGNSYDLISEIEYEGASHYEFFDATYTKSLRFYQVRAFYDYGEQTCESQPAHSLDNPNNNFVMVNVTAVDEESAFTTIYPNPANDKLHVECTSNISELKVYNMVGAMVYSLSNCDNNVVISLADMPNGIYFITLTTNGSTETRRFVKE